MDPHDYRSADDMDAEIHAAFGPVLRFLAVAALVALALGAAAWWLAG